MTETGMVLLVGAGPGDPGLLTLRGKDCLEQAEVVVYDNLANPQLLEYVPAEAERIYVGKEAGRHTLSQDRINALLVDLGLAGRRVVRLKGGDPFVFGRGGEEALALRAAGIRVEVVPGVTAGVAAPAYAGMPVTHRGLSSTVTFVTGHEDPRKDESSLNWEALAKGGGTLAFYMGVRNLPAIVQRLIEAGRAAATPAALIRRGTHPDQRVVDGSLGTIVARAKEAGLKPPAIFLVGDVVGLRRDLEWVEEPPLSGKTVVVTRSRTQASELAARLRRLGADVLLFPTIRIEPVEDRRPLVQAARSAGAFDWVVFTSVNGVDSFFAALDEGGGDARGLAGCKVCAIGSTTADALRSRGIKADLVPPRFTSRALFEALRGATRLEGKRILLPTADIAPPYLPDELRQAGAEVVVVVAYRTLPGRPEAAVFQAFRSANVDVVTFTSSSTARNFAAIIREELGELPADVAYASIGPETSRTASESGMDVAIEAVEHTVDGLVEAVVRQLEGA